MPRTPSVKARYTAYTAAKDEYIKALLHAIYIVIDTECQGSPEVLSDRLGKSRSYVRSILYRSTISGLQSLYEEIHGPL